MMSEFNAFGMSNEWVINSNDLTLDIDDSYTSCKYILDNMMSIRS